MVAVLLLMLGNVRAALLTALVIPLSMLMLMTGMVASKGVSANLMSLGALDFGLIVDGAVIIVENCILRLGQRQHQLGACSISRSGCNTVFKATREVFTPSLVSVLVVILVNLPILALTGVEGKMFQPMAFAVIMALLAALALSLTFVPAAVALVPHAAGSRRRRTRIVAGAQPRLRARAGRRAAPAVPRPRWRRGLRRRSAAGSPPGWARSSSPASTRATSPCRPCAFPAPAYPVARDAVPARARTQRRSGSQDASSRRLGTAEVATDPMPPNIADGYVMLKDREDWPDPRKTKADAGRGNRSSGSTGCPATPTKSASRSSCASTS